MPSTRQGVWRAPHNVIMWHSELQDAGEGWYHHCALHLRWSEA